MALDRIDAMRAFCRIIELGSFTRAANSLNVASTTVSWQIQALERLLEVKLLHRTTRKVYPSNEGLAYYHRARKVIDDIDDLEASVSMSRGVVRGRVVIEMPSPVGINLVIPGLADFTDKYQKFSWILGAVSVSWASCRKGLTALSGVAKSRTKILLRESLERCVFVYAHQQPI